MAIEQFNEDVEVISKLGDLPNQDDGLTAEELKAKFDQASVAIKKFINEILVPVINELDAAKDPEIIYGLDTSLSQEGRAADAEAVGAALEDKFGKGDIIPLANGGTGAATAAAARTALGAAASTHYHSASQINFGTLPVARGGTGGATADAARKSLGAAGNENLLDNWYFGDPVNQRGQTEYTAEGFTLDRWSLALSTSTVNPSLTVGDGCIVLHNETATGTTCSCYIMQTIDNPGRFSGKAVTFSAKFKGVESANNAIIKIRSSGGNSSTKYVTVDDANSVVSVTMTLAANITSLNVCIGAMMSHGGDGSFDLEIESAKLEIGSVSTLANDAPPRKSEQLLECQRYYIRFAANGGGQWLMGASNGATAYCPIHLPVPMRGTAQPTFTYGGDINLYNYVSGGIVEFTSLYIPEGANVSRQSFVIYAAHASNAIASKCPANLRLYSGAWIAFSCDI